MAKYIIDSDTLEGLGDSIRSVTGSTKKFTPEEMIEEVRNILDATTFILVDQDGNEYPAVYVDSDTVCTATANDIRKGSVAITPDGVIEGTKVIPAYHTTEGYTLVTAGKNFSIPVRNGRCDYTKLQALLCVYNKTPNNSVATDRVVIGDSVYAVNSTELISTVTVDSEKQTIDLNITNDSKTIYIIRYFMYKEEY